MHWIIILSLVCGILPVMAVTAFSADEANTIDREVERRLARGEQANRLIKAQSPYLLQHSFNPVDWYPWGKEAFARAVAEDKPIFLSIGYSTCHWCHVMAHESFEDQETGRLLNTWFVSIKVDREERPDIDQMYMAATQAMTGSGGWPMSVFLLPDGSPFYAGTYFPPNATGGHPGFKDLLRAIHKAWLERRGDIQNSAERLVAALESDTAPSGSSIDEGAIDRCYSQLAASFDHRHGGFGKAPKFPRPSIISFLFSYFSATGKDSAKDMALQTLDNMAAGGLYDQLGGGFHRYSVDERWFVPHFEKMLYDQAQLLNVYLDAFQITGETKYRSIVEEMFRYLSRDMRNPAGGYYSAEDADSENPYDRKEHGEGAYYLWRADEIINILGKDDAALFMKYYGARDEGNVINDPMREFTGRNILFISSEGIGAPPEKIQAVLARAKEKLFTVRQLRNRPHLDDKVITSWNGMMMGALAKGSRLLNDPKMLNEAVHIASFIRESLFDVESGNLQRRFRRQVAGLPGQLDDYTNLVAGLLELYLASHDPKWLRWAVALTKKQIDLFWNEKGGFFYDSVIDPTVKIRMRDRHDGAEPAGNSVAALNLLNLGHLRNNFQWLKMAGRLMESYSETLNNYPTSLPLMLSAWQQMGSKGSQIVIAGQRGARETNTMLQIGYSAPTSLVLLADGGENQSYLAEKLPFLKNVARIDNKATAYFCRDFTCKLPVTDPVSLKLQIRDQSTQ